MAQNAMKYRAHVYSGEGRTHLHYVAFCHCCTGQFASMSAAKCSKFSTYFRHNFCPATHYGMVIKRWNISEKNHIVNYIHTHIMEQRIPLEAYFSRFGPKTDFHFSKCKATPKNWANISHSCQIDTIFGTAPQKSGTGPVGGSQFNKLLNQRPN